MDDGLRIELDGAGLKARQRQHKHAEYCRKDTIHGRLPVRRFSGAESPSVVPTRVRAQIAGYFFGSSGLVISRAPRWNVR
jgi:hypothetical protein